MNRKRVARLMRSIGLAGLRLRTRHRTTIPGPAAAKAPDLIGRDFTAEAVNTKHVGDITWYRIRAKGPTWRRRSIGRRWLLGIGHECAAVI